MTYYFFPIFSVCANTSTSCLSAGMTLFVDFPSDSSISSVPFEVAVPRSVRSINVNFNMSSSPMDSSTVNSDSSCDGTGEAERGIQSANRRSSRWINYVTCKSHTDETAMDKYLSERPNTILKQSKYSRDRTKKYEYRCCSCGCEFRLLIVVEMVNGSAFETRETSVPDSHDPLSEVVNRRRRMDKEVSVMIVKLLEQNQFSKNFGPKRIMSELRRRNIAEERIPSRIQIQNKLSYHRRTVFNFNNEITPLQDKVRLSVFNGEEAEDQPFVFVYDVDNSNRLVHRGFFCSDFVI
jgi:hypothetical protein